MRQDWVVWCFWIMTCACLAVLIGVLIFQQTEINSLNSGTSTTTIAPTIAPTAPPSANRLGRVAPPGAFGPFIKPKVATAAAAKPAAKPAAADPLLERKRAAAAKFPVFPGKTKRISLPPKTAKPVLNNNSKSLFANVAKKAPQKDVSSDVSSSERTEKDRAERSAMAMAEKEKQHKQAPKQTVNAPKPTVAAPKPKVASAAAPIKPVVVQPVADAPEQPLHSDLGKRALTMQERVRARYAKQQ